jgi:hypothetical protein
MHDPFRLTVGQRFPLPPPAGPVSAPIAVVEVFAFPNDTPRFLAWRIAIGHTLDYRHTAKAKTGGIAEKKTDVSI